MKYALDLADRTFGSTIKKARGYTKGLDNAVGKVTRKFRKMGRQGKKSFDGLSRSAKRAARVVAAVFLTGQAIAFAKEITNVAARFEGFENAIEFASGKEGAKNLQFVRDTVNLLNTDLEASYRGFQTITGSLKGTILEGQGARDIFEGVSIAATTMNLSADNLNGALLAFGQIASKGKVQAEELRGQLGERIPGAFNIAAKAMGVTQVELNKMLDQGKLYANDFLPKFAAQLKKEFSGGLEKAANSMQAAINKQNNAIISFKRSTADFLRPMLIGAQLGIGKILGHIEKLLPKLEPLKGAFYDLLISISPIFDALGRLGGKMGGTSGIIDSLATGIRGLAVVTEILATGLAGVIDFLGPSLPVLAGVAAGWWAVNVAMYANPIGLVVLAIVALVGAVTYAWQKVGWFRGGIMAAWEAIKGFGEALKTAVVDRFKEMLQSITGIARAIKLFFSGEWEEAFKAGKEAADKLFSRKTGDAFIKDMKGVGKKSSDAYFEGVRQAQKNQNAPNALDGILKGLAPGTANSKFLGGTGGPLGTDPKSTPRAAPTGGGSVAGSGGPANKHTTFNIQSMVQNLTIQTTNITGSPSDVKKQLERVFLELIADLELRANG
ncbi:tape measure protein [Spongiimicrobium salis]|uniref:tape measure protein n=1 Tax=Spongiimicrobium salis TaxID=1667022 RepID=UPI00374CDF15